MNFFHQIENILREWAHRTPVEIYTLVGAFVEEVIAPIPSPLILATAGSIAFEQGKGHAALLWLSVIGAFGKTIGSWIIYFVASRLEFVFIKRFGRFFGVSQKDVEQAGKYFKGGPRDWLILFTLRALPIVPSSLVSVVCGLLRIDLRLFYVATFFGNIVRNLVYIYMGYLGVATYHSLLEGLGTAESMVQLVALFLVLLFVGWVYYRRKKGGPLFKV